jgi:hypothetical protein
MGFRGDRGGLDGRRSDFRCNLAAGRLGLENKRLSPPRGEPEAGITTAIGTPVAFSPVAEI